MYWITFRFELHLDLTEIKLIPKLNNNNESKLKNKKVIVVDDELTC